MATYTAADIKKVLNRKGDQSGFAFDKNAPYFVNAERLKAMKEHFALMVESDEDRPAAKKRMTSRTIDAVENWFANLADRYGI